MTSGMGLLDFVPMASVCFGFFTWCIGLVLPRLSDRSVELRRFLVLRTWSVFFMAFGVFCAFVRWAFDGRFV